LSLKRIIIDTDPGVDDALAFLLAIASPEIQLEALTTTQGNVTLDKATRTA
jgi:inosine-uridine nucleoside N-ribohydrolase